MRRLLRCDQGSAPLEFALVAPLVALLGLAVVQLALALHVRSTLAAAAAEGARSAAVASGTPGEAVRRTREVLDGNLAADVVEAVRVTTERRDGLPVTTVRVTARLPLVGLLGPAALEVSGSAIREPR